MIMVLVELVGRAAPILVNNKKRDLNTSASKSERIVNALKNYEDYNHEVVTMETFTAINDLSTMHDDICQVIISTHNMCLYKVIYIYYVYKDRVNNPNAHACLTVVKHTNMFESVVMHT